MGSRTFQMQCTDGSQRFACEWQPENTQRVKGVIGIIHGMGEHIGRYDHVADMFTANDYVVLGFDQCGHGRTEGKRGHTVSYEALLLGIDGMLAHARHTYPDVPVYLFGHSMGGNVTLNYILRRKPAIEGAIITGPWLKLAFSPPPLQVVIARIVERVLPAYTSKRPLNVDHLTSDPGMMEMYRNDTLGHGNITARFFLSIQSAGLWALKHASEWSIPLLLMHGGSDRVTSINASRQFAQAAGPNCTFMEWTGFQHELHNESKREEVFTTMIGWLEQRNS
ncbi:lysophospholipase [Paenibacillus baekrokdamisoli]|uniref:Lysophospholipase n=1 Tax=Paenibacillus baekrokdamisoli TaxID=1712516 RepID=A0A3G9IZ80_9BACL|nr:alpha/beta hydrolase [Paenibacillus baekrokdamisoli]MBB3071807.1 alpha-beta hydrolase superfamily lysophospholipase [Paenibacillus baekrokdamisoli]BBH24210.1 lysophospholipase [Paenibacillus baekrokdamisoli]